VSPNPNAFLVSSVPWDIFGTLTFRRVLPGESWALGTGLEWLEKVRTRLFLPVGDYYYLLRVEGGERFGRVHLHVLLRVPNCYRSLFLTPSGIIPAAHRLWGRGLTTFRRVDSKSDPATAYTIKLETSGADEYELKKTVRCSVCIPSEALKRRMLLQQSAVGGGLNAGHDAGLRTLAEISPCAQEGFIPHGAGSAS